MIIFYDIILVLAAGVLSALFSGAETGSYAISRLRLRYRASTGFLWAKKLEHLLEDMPSFVTAILVWNNIWIYLLSAATTSIFENEFPNINPAVGTTITAGPLMFVFSELIPKNTFRLHAEALMARLTRMLTLSVALVKPVAIFFAHIGNMLRKIFRMRAPRHWADFSRNALSSHFKPGSTQHLQKNQVRLVDNILSSGTSPAQMAALKAENCKLLPASCKTKELLKERDEFVLIGNNLEDITALVKPLSAWAENTSELATDLAIKHTWLARDVSILDALLAMRTEGVEFGIIADENKSGTHSALGVVSIEHLVAHLAK